MLLFITAGAVLSSDINAQPFQQRRSFSQETQGIGEPRSSPSDPSGGHSDVGLPDWAESHPPDAGRSTRRSDRARRTAPTRAAESSGPGPQPEGIPVGGNLGYLVLVGGMYAAWKLGVEEQDD